MKGMVMRAWEVRAALDRRKTQARKVITPQPEGAAYWTEYQGAWYPNCEARPAVLRCPYGGKGEELFVKEAFARNGERVWYRADYPASIPMYASRLSGGTGWRPAQQMREEWSRMRLLVRKVRVERLQDMDDRDARCEGVSLYHRVTQYEGMWREAFAQLWDEGKGKRGMAWGENPWVWVVEFVCC